MKLFPPNIVEVEKETYRLVSHNTKYHMKIDNLLKQLGGSCLVVSILAFFANCALAEEHRGPSHDKHGKTEAHSSGSSHQKSSSSSMRDRWNKMSDKERDEARERIKESWAKRMREAKERHSRGGDRDHGERDHRDDHEKRDAHHAGSSHGKSGDHHGKSHGKPSGDHGKSHGKPGDHHGKPEARKDHFPHGHSSIFSKMRDKWNGMSEKEKGAVRDRMRRAGEAWKEHLRERFSHHKSGGDHREHRGKTDGGHGKCPQARHGDHHRGPSHAGRPPQHRPSSAHGKPGGPPHRGGPGGPPRGKPSCDHGKRPQASPGDQHRGSHGGPPRHARAGGQHGKPPHARPSGQHRRGPGGPPRHARPGGQKGKPPHARAGGQHRGRGGPPQSARPNCKRCGKHGSKRR